jgi:hypothetical protein
LPQRYEAARTALAACADIDEVQDWADKDAAVASYARQSKDDGLLIMAKRIQARAVRRCGELLSQIPASSGGDRGNSATGGRRPVGETRTAAATAAGLSDHQRKTALRVAAMPATTFESQVESPRPPSVTQASGSGRAANSAERPANGAATPGNLRTDTRQDLPTNSPSNSSENSSRNTLKERAAHAGVIEISMEEKQRRAEEQAKRAAEEQSQRAAAKAKRETEATAQRRAAVLKAIEKLPEFTDAEIAKVTQSSVHEVEQLRRQA